MWTTNHGHATVEENEASGGWHSHSPSRSGAPRYAVRLPPDRRPTPDFFVCDILDAAPKGDMASMEHPIFPLSTKPDLRTRWYEHGSVFIEVAVGQGIGDGTRSRHSDLLHLALDGDPE